ncbi:MAG: sirohydrochlorin chelatase [Magnetovibrio sp.]|nr:sirohydrochlorin chelatase [Magnetovibrio sp.]|tara:strand:+ start:1136 stop:2128 length:993 start_codon:yes stop_codon:yes gene_type:complete
MMDKHAVMICGHGSRDDFAIEEFNSLAFHLRNRLPEIEIESGFLEFATPIIRTGLEKLKAKGAKKIVCLPGMLFAAGHVKNDLPSEINNFGAENPGIEMVFGRELAIDSKLLRAAQDRIEEAERNASNSIPRKDTLLMVVGRGTNDSDANSNVSKVTRMLWEGMGFGWAEVSYSGVAFPLVNEGLERVLKLGYKRIIVFPYFLFTGILVRRIYTWADEIATANPNIEIVKASYLNDHEQLIDCFLDRIEEALNGSNNMNCLLCKYREQIIGYEHDHGAAQVGHHHHVVGIGTDGHEASDHGVHHGHHHHGHNHNHDSDHHHDHNNAHKKD